MEQPRDTLDIASVGELRRHARSAWTRGIGVLRVTTTGGAAGYLVWQAIAILEGGERGGSHVRPDRGLMRGQGAAAAELLWALWSAVAGTTRENQPIDNARRLALLTSADDTLRGILDGLGDERDEALAQKYDLLVTKRRERIARAIAKVDIDSIAASLAPPQRHAGNTCAIACEAHRWSVACSLAAAPVPEDRSELAIHAAVARESRIARSRVLYMVRIELDGVGFAATGTLRARCASLAARARMLDAREDSTDDEVARLVDEVLALDLHAAAVVLEAR